jgi:hypothetical protein
MLDDLDQHGRLIADQSWVSVEQLTMDEREALVLRWGEVLQVQAGCGTVETASGHVHADDVAEALIVQEHPYECAVTTAQGENASDAPVMQSSQHRLETVVLEPDGGFQSVLGFTALCLSRVTISVIFVGELNQRSVGEGTLVFQIPAGNELALGVPAQPPLPMPQELGHLILANPVMRLIVQHGDHHIHMPQQVAKLHGAGQGDGAVFAVPPLGKSRIQGVRLGVDAVPQGLK